MLSGRCHCGAVSFEMGKVSGHQAICHCEDCRRHAGAPMVAWALVRREDIEIRGTPLVYASSEHGRRHFCGHCGTPLFYTNDVIFPDMVDVMIATLDRPEAVAPTAEIQIAERIAWMTPIGGLTQVERFPED